MSQIKYYIELCKPRITFFCLIMAAGGVILTSHKISILSLIMLFIGTALTVSSANTFNMIYERDSDKFMKRTQFRPLVIGKIKVLHATLFAFIIGAIGIFLLSFFVNILTAFISFCAIFFYAAIYTPLKSKTPLALVIGAIPGAIPPLLGWTAVNNTITLAGLSLFGVLFLWQMPHFIAISIQHKEDYKRAGIKVVPAVRGDKVAKYQALIWSICLFITSLSIAHFNLGGIIYIIFAVPLGLWFLFISIEGLIKPLPTWPRKFFLASLIYLPALVLGLIIDRLASSFIVF